MKLAIVHDFLNQFGGAERVVETLHEVFPDAPIFTSIYDKKNMPDQFRNMNIKTSFMQRFPGVMKHYKPYLAFYPYAFESMQLKNYDVILSSSSSFAKGIKKRPDSLHICYCNNPMRFVWRYNDYIKSESAPALVKYFLPLYLNRLKMWDIRTSATVDYFIANSMNVARRIIESYGRESTVIYPPVDTSKFHISQNVGDYYLVVSRLKPYKRIDLVVNAFNQLKKPLKIVGSGDFEQKLKSMAGKNVQFLGNINDKELAEVYSKSKALIFPGEEDFGLVPVEAMASGRPVIAYGKGGALETVVEGLSGVFFYEPSADSLIDAVEKFEASSFDPKSITDHAKSFDKENFKTKIRSFIQEKYKAN